MLIEGFLCPLWTVALQNMGTVLARIWKESKRWENITWTVIPPLPSLEAWNKISGLTTQSLLFPFPFLFTPLAANIGPDYSPPVAQGVHSSSQQLKNRHSQLKEEMESNGRLWNCSENKRKNWTSRPQRWEPYWKEAQLTAPVLHWKWLQLFSILTSLPKSQHARRERKWWSSLCYSGAGLILEGKLRDCAKKERGMPSSQAQQCPR